MKLNSVTETNMYTEHIVNCGERCVLMLKKAAYQFQLDMT